MSQGVFETDADYEWRMANKETIETFEHLWVSGIKCNLCKTSFSCYGNEHLDVYNSVNKCPTHSREVGAREKPS